MKALLTVLLATLMCGPAGCGDDDDSAGDGDADADADTDADTDADADHPCGDLCAGSDNCIRAQVLDFETNEPVTQDGLVAIVYDGVAVPIVPLATVPVDPTNGCFVAPDLDVTSTPVRLVQIDDESATIPGTPPPEGEPDLVASMSNDTTPGDTPGVCCSYPMMALSRELLDTWDAALGLDDADGEIFTDDDPLHQQGAFVGIVLDADGVPVEGATITNTGAVERRTQYLNADMSGFVAAGTATSASGAFVIPSEGSEAVPVELATLSATDTAGNVYPAIPTGTSVFDTEFVLIQAQ